MKKIILTALTVLMIFGLVGCSGVLHNTPAPVQEAVKIDGASWYSYDITVWGNNDPADEKPSNIIINDNGKGKQTVDTKLPAFEASKGGVAYYTLDATKPLKDGKFELNVAYQDDNPAYTAKPGVLRVYVYTNLENPTIYIWDDADCPFEKSSAWPGSPITLAGATVGTPFYLDGYFLKGSFLDTEWNSDAKYLFDNPEEDPYGNLVYTVDFNPAKTDAYFAIVKNSDNSRWYGNTSVGQNEVKFENTTDGMKSGELSGFEVGKAYRLVVKTTPTEDVYVKVFELANATVKFEVTGLAAGNAAWMNGTIWGDSWPQGWPIAAWNNPAKSGLDAAIAGDDGVATFADNWNVVISGEIGETKSYVIQAIACSDSAWAGADVLESKQTVDIKLTKSGTYTVSFAKDGTVTVKNPQ